MICTAAVGSPFIYVSWAVVCRAATPPLSFPFLLLPMRTSHSVPFEARSPDTSHFRPHHLCVLSPAAQSSLGGDHLTMSSFSDANPLPEHTSSNPSLCNFPNLQGAERSCHQEGAGGLGLSPSPSSTVPQPLSQLLRKTDKCLPKECCCC